MDDGNLNEGFAPRVLASDLDGTLIPLPGIQENFDDLAALKRALEAFEVPLVFATGRHFTSVLEALSQYGLPVPGWIISDVGTGIYRQSCDRWEPFAPYAEHLSERVDGVDHDEIFEMTCSVRGVEPQDEDHQGRFKVSFTTPVDQMESVVDEIRGLMEGKSLPFDVLGSVDPFQGRGMVDLLPRGVSKAYALDWLAVHANYHREEIVYAGDSGNDYSALIAGFRAIVVANATQGLPERVAEAHRDSGFQNRLFVARRPATSGLLDGCCHFGLCRR